MSNIFNKLMFNDDLPIPVIIDATAGGSLDFDVISAKCTLHSKIPPATKDNCWTVVPSGTVLSGANVDSYLGPLIIAKCKKAVTVNWHNKTAKGKTQSAPPINIINPILTMKADRWQSPKGLSMHLHGGKLLAQSDGWPLDEKTPSETQTCQYPNKQASNLIWYHDHAMDWTARNVYAGIAGGYLIRDKFDNRLMALLNPKNEIPLVFQDRQLWDPDATPDKDALQLTAKMRYEIDARVPDPLNQPLTRPAPYGVDGLVDVIPELVGEFNLVNGKLWPKHTLPVRDLYRLRIINGCNARTYALKLMAQIGGAWQFVSDLMTVIGTDGGLLGAAIPITASDALVIAPGERRDVILDLRHFSADEVNGFAQLFLVNVASVPFASNEESVPSSTNGLVGLTPASILDTATTLEDAPFHPQLQAFPQVMRFDVNMQTAAQRRPNFLSIELPTSLIAARSAIKEFKYKNALGWQPRSGIDFGPNRIFLLDNQTFSMPVGNKSVGMMYLHECRRLPAKTPISAADLILPWDIDTDTLITPRSASPATKVHYQFDRRITKNTAHQAHSMHADPAMNDTFEQQLITQPPKAGTYERWYFINLEAGDAEQAGTPDMHPIHIHLVNFYLSRAWRVADTSGQGKPVTPSSLSKSVTPITNIGLYAKLGLRDTVRIAGNCIVEFILYFPPGYEQPSKPLPSAISRYPFHCHILEHEEMGMMRYFDYC